MGLLISDEWTDESRETVTVCSAGLSHLLHNRRSSSPCVSNLLVYTWRETRETTEAQMMKDASQAKMSNRS